MIPVKHIDPDNLALYAMQLLSPEEMEEMTLHLQHSAEARRVLAGIQSDLSIYALTAEMHSPPAMARQRLMQQVAREKKVIPIERPVVQEPVYQEDEGDHELPMRTLFEEERKSPGARILPWIGWAIAAGLAVEVGSLYRQQQMLQTVETSEEAQVAKLNADLDRADLVVQTVKDPGALRVDMVTTNERPEPHGRVSYLANKGALVLIASNLEPLSPYKTYELWLIPADGTDPIPAGTFQPDAHGNATMVLPSIPKGKPARNFGVTIEDLGGSQTPTLPIIMKGTAT